MCFKIFLVLIVSLWVVQCHVLNKETRLSRPTSLETSLQKKTVLNLIFPTVVNRKSRIHEKNLLRTRRQAFKTRQSRGWPGSSTQYYNSYNSQPMSNSDRYSDSDNSNEQNQQEQRPSSSIHNVNWDNIHVISFNRARGRPTTSDYGESGERNNNRYQPQNYQYESTNRRQSYGDNIYEDNSDSSSNTNPRRTGSSHNDNERRHGFTASLERHYDSEHELEFSDHDIKGSDGDDYSQRQPQVLPRPPRTYDQIYRTAYDA